MALSFNKQNIFTPVNLGPFLDPKLSCDYNKAWAKYETDQDFKHDLGRTFYFGKGLDVSFFIGTRGQDTMKDVKLVEMIARRDIREFHGLDTAEIDAILRHHPTPPKLKTTCYNPRQINDPT